MNVAEHKINTMCNALKVLRSGYYQWIRKPKVPDKQIQLLDSIRRSFIESRKTYGAPRIYKQLRSEGIYCGRNRIAKYMREDGIVARKRKKYKKPVSKQRIKPLAANILDRQFNVSLKDQVWASDVSYFWTYNGWIHLAIVMDLFSRKIIGWSMSDKVDKQLTKNAVEMAIEDRKPDNPVLHHSDQGAEYTNKNYQEILRKNNINASMSRRANCYDNAVVESFFKTIKTELTRHQKFRTKEEARTAIFEYIEVFYNRKRLHSTLGYVSPERYEQINTIN